MERKIILTGDGSHSINIPEMKVTYHSIHGAIQESMHVFIEAGLHGSGRLQQPEPCSILEVGFGTGLNALLTLIEAEKKRTSIYYVALEPYPLSNEEVHLLNYCELSKHKELQGDFLKMHQCQWNKSIAVTENFLMHKSNYTLQGFEDKVKFDLIYFDAFAPNAQPELWTKEVFDKLYSMMKEGSILVTYCSKGEVRRNMQSAGFKVEKIPGPPHKREMLRGRKES
jgi:tRNA U34 5-methylaminomethyl-2-thiouridine-forming methyltransferase MnmC